MKKHKPDNKNDLIGERIHILFILGFVFFLLFTIACQSQDRIDLKPHTTYSIEKLKLDSTLVIMRHGTVFRVKQISGYATFVYDNVSFPEMNPVQPIIKIGNCEAPLKIYISVLIDLKLYSKQCEEYFDPETIEFCLPEDW